MPAGRISSGCPSYSVQLRHHRQTRLIGYYIHTCTGNRVVDKHCRVYTYFTRAQTELSIRECIKLFHQKDPSQLR
ncbi:hypothetical protein DPMN_167590 [Dreissena polymorpha]|uniref:Uncharacterized protein n=1 Tax=Dreissena polymorpha TaxID=45954 RepID=A0A9D4IV62_DREPO|nr:hypothetical protein DPMN_167590 [Dreissena polymorpha]